MGEGRKLINRAINAAACVTRYLFSSIRCLHTSPPPSARGSCLPPWSLLPNSPPLTLTPTVYLCILENRHLSSNLLLIDC